MSRFFANFKDGNYRCDCHKGFVGNDVERICNDINECETQASEFKILNMISESNFQ